MSLSKRGAHVVANPVLMEYLTEHFPRIGSAGYVPACVAENVLCGEEMAERLAAVPPMPAHALHYGPMIGDPEFRTAVVDLLVRRNVFPAGVFTAEHVALVAGVGSALELLFQALADPGEGVLVPTPTYAGFFMDLGTRDALEIVLVPRTAASGFALTVDALDAAYASATVPIRALLLTNPDNPLGRMYPADELAAAVAWARAKGIHVVFDEIYALSLFNLEPDTEFTSAARILGADGLGDDCHIVWGFSKDFGVGGLRCGGVFTHNAAVIPAIDAYSYWAAVSRHTQWALSDLIADAEWTDTYLATSAARLKAAYTTVTAALDTAGIPYVAADAAMFLVVDLRAYLPEPTWEGESVLWRTLLDSLSLNLTPGSELRASDPGWFRLCFAGLHDIDALAAAIAAIPTAGSSAQPDAQPDAQA